MASTFHHIRDYTGRHAPKNTVMESPLQCTRIDLCRGLITVGNPSFLSWETIRLHGFARAIHDAVLAKAALVMTNLRVRNGFICRHKIFDSYVADQKRIVTYNLGMAFAKLYAEKVFSIPSLVHVEFLKKRDAIVVNKTTGSTRNKEPDLVGSDLSGRWHVFEAKGVSGSESQLTRKIGEAKEQLSQVISVHTADPDTRTACATFLGVDRIITHLVDPPTNVERAIEISRETYLDAYYSPFVAAQNSEISTLRRNQRIDGISVETITLRKGSGRLVFGLETEVFEQAIDRKYEFSDSLRGKLRQYSQRTDILFSIGLDGYFCQYTG